MSGMELDVEGSSASSSSSSSSSTGAAAAAAASSPSGTTRPPRLELTKWNVVAIWSWNVDQNNCAICRNLINDPCIECQANAGSAQADDCTIAWGTCNHGFHFHCISRWLRDRETCPIDDQDWCYQKYSDR